MEVEMNVPGVHHYQHHQEITSQTLESMLVCTKPQEDKKPKPPEEPLKCPRCDSSNTKFCYYNNYSLTQPRYFCKSCRRYWTKGGTLRNVPVGGGCRKNRRSSSATSSVTSAVTSPNSSCYAISKTRGPLDHHQLMQQQQNPLSLLTHNSSNNHVLAGLPHLPYGSSSTDLSLAFARLQNQANGSMGYDHFDHVEHHLGSSGNVDPLGFLGFLENRNTNTNTNMNMGNQFYHNQNVMYNNVGNDDDQEQQHMLNPMTTVKQEACNTGLWVYEGNMAHEVESGRSMIGGWNGIIGSTNWHGLINSPLM